MYLADNGNIKPVLVGKCDVDALNTHDIFALEMNLYCHKIVTLLRNRYLHEILLFFHVEYFFHGYLFIICVVKWLLALPKVQSMLGSCSGCCCRLDVTVLHILVNAPKLKGYKKVKSMQSYIPSWTLHGTEEEFGIWTWEKQNSQS